MGTLKKLVKSSNIVSERQTVDFSVRIFEVVSNRFMINQRKHCSKSVVEDKVADFKRLERKND